MIGEAYVPMGNVRKIDRQKKLKSHQFCFANVRKKIAVVFRGLFRTQSNICERVLLQKSLIA